MFSIKTTVVPEFTPISGSDMIAFLRLNDTAEESLLAEFADAACDLFSVYTGNVLASQTMMLQLDKFPLKANWRTAHYESFIYIPRTPVTAISLTEYLDTNGDWQTLDGTSVDLDSMPARVVLPTSLPLTYNNVPKVRVTFTAGYSAADVIPNSMLLSCKLLAAHWYENRSAYVNGTLNELPMGWLNLAARWDTGIQGDWNEH
jgi:uncharacterized phiE125 gp8 family phage protein